MFVIIERIFFFFLAVEEFPCVDVLLFSWFLPVVVIIWRFKLSYCICYSIGTFFYSFEYVCKNLPVPELSNFLASRELSIDDPSPLLLFWPSVVAIDCHSWFILSYGRLPISGFGFWAALAVDLPRWCDWENFIILRKVILLFNTRFKEDYYSSLIISNHEALYSLWINPNVYSIPWLLNRLYKVELVYGII